MTSVPAVASSANEPAFAGRSPHSGGEIRNALRSLWPHFAMAGIFSSCINLLYLSSPLYLMQVYNRVLVNENITTLILLTLVLAVALLAMAALDTIRAQILIRCGIRLDKRERFHQLR